jgi:SCY1-like protein 2
MATLSVQEAMGLKVDREAVATLVLPQLWAMSIGPCKFYFCFTFFFSNISTVLNVEQFQRFMAVIKKLGDRVEKEHDQFLRDSQRIEDRSATATNGSLDLTTRGGMNFETLVGGAGAGSINADTELNGNWEDDVWGSILSTNSEVRIPPQGKENAMTDFCRPLQSPSITQTTFASSMSAQSQPTTQSLPSSPRMGTSIGAAQSARPLTGRSTTGSNGLLPVASLTPLSSSAHPSTSSHSIGPPPASNARSKYQGSLLSAQGTKQSTPQPPQRSTLPKPNYNISLSDVTTNASQQPPPFSAPFMTSPSQMNPLYASPPTSNALSTTPLVSPPAFFPRPGMGDILTPLKPQRTSLSGVGTKTQTSKDILSDFDPLA